MHFSYFGLVFSLELDSEKIFSETKKNDRDIFFARNPNLDKLKLSFTVIEKKSRIKLKDLKFYVG